MRRRQVAIGIICTLVAGLLGPAVQPALAVDANAKIQPRVLRGLEAGTLDTFVVEFVARADLKAAAAIKGWAARGRAVYRTLTSVADRSQGRAKAIVRGTPGVRAESFWLTNVLVVTGGATPALAQRLARLAGVSKIRAERTFPLVEPVERHAVVIAEDEPTPYGITTIGADDVWAEGILGSGVVVGNVDTGVDYTHEALVEQYRGNNGGHLRPRLLLVGPDRGSAETSPATTRSTAPTRWARWSAVTGPDRSRPTSASRRARTGSPRRDARTSSAARPRSCRRASSCSPRRT